MVGKAGDQALRRSAFKEAIAHLGKAIAMADKAGATARRATDGSAPPNQRLTQLHVTYGNALIAARGYSAPETTEAFAKARKSAAGDKDSAGRLASDYGLWAGAYVGGDLKSMRAHAEAFLTDVEATPESAEAGVAYRAAGMTHWFVGQYREARDHFEKALDLFQPGRDDDLAFRFEGDPDRAVAILDEAPAICDRTEDRAFEAELHRVRGEILLKLDPVSPAPAEEAFQTAIAVAKRQGTRSFELRAALALAKLFQSAGRPPDAHAVLVPALKGFSPTPEMPEIAEAQGLLAEVAQ